MFKTTLFSVLLLAVALQTVNAKPACGCDRAHPALAPCQPEPCVAKQPCVTKQPCVANQPCVVRQTAPCTTTTTTTTTTQRPSTTTTTTTTAAPRVGCTNGDIYPISRGSCNEFLMCNNKVYVLMVCPVGLGFNYQTKSCDRYANVPACSAHY